MNLRTFLSVLLLYRSNFHVLHWMAEGKNFFKIHEKAAEYYNEILNDVDIVAEMILRREDGEIVNYKEVLELIESDEDNTFLLISSSEVHDSKSFKKYSEKMFKDILKCIEDLLSSEEIMDPKNVGIKATLEGMHDKYDLQCNYLLRRFGE